MDAMEIGNCCIVRNWKEGPLGKCWLDNIGQISSNFLAKQKRWESWPGQKRRYLRPPRSDVAANGVIRTVVRKPSKGTEYALIKCPCDRQDCFNFKYTMGLKKTRWRHSLASLGVLGDPRRFQRRLALRATLGVRRSQNPAFSAPLGFFGENRWTQVRPSYMGRTHLTRRTRWMWYRMKYLHLPGGWREAESRLWSDQKAIKGGSSRRSFSVNFRISKWQRLHS